MADRKTNTRIAQVGFSLPEALLCVAIIAIMLRLALPLFSPLYEEEGRRLLAEFDAVLHTARSAAIRQGQPVRVCPAGTAHACGNDWRQGVMAILENPDAAQPLIAHRPWQDVQGTLSWRAFGNRQYLVIDATGSLDYQNGTLLWCPPHDLDATAQQLIVNSAGRTRRVTGVTDARCE